MSHKKSHAMPTGADVTRQVEKLVIGLATKRHKFLSFLIARKFTARDNATKVIEAFYKKDPSKKVKELQSTNPNAIGARGRALGKALRADLDKFFRNWRDGKYPNADVKPGRAVEIRLLKAFRPHYEWISRENHSERPSPVRTSRYQRQFWEPYFSTEDASRKNIIFYGEPLFARDKNGHSYHRVVGHEAEEKASRSDRFVPCHTFLNAGEVKCLLNLLRWFRDRDVLFDTSGRRHESSGAQLGENEDERRSNCIFLGVPGNNRLISEYQQHEGFKFVVGTGGIYRPKAKRPVYSDKAGKWGFAVVSRMPGQMLGEKDSTVTIISSDVGRAIQGVGQVLTSPGELESVCTKLKQPDDPWPETFQLVFKVIMKDGDEDIPSQALLADWFPKPFKVSVAKLCTRPRGGAKLIAADPLQKPPARVSSKTKTRSVRSAPNAFTPAS